MVNLLDSYCPVCDLLFASKQRRYTHDAKKHAGVHTQATITPDELLVKFSASHNYQTRTCPMCRKHFGSQRACLRHRTKVHKEVLSSNQGFHNINCGTHNVQDVSQLQPAVKKEKHIASQVDVKLVWQELDDFKKEAEVLKKDITKEKAKYVAFVYECQ